MNDLYDAARAAISEAFGAINGLPHGDGIQAQRLIEAQTSLAAARRALDAWWDTESGLDVPVDGRA